MAVRMQHSGLPDGQDIEVAEISVAAYERMGWTVVDNGAAPKTQAAAKSRRRTEEENS
ncbi:hypothetical protein JHN55_07075 [Streptomyces sp. MBT56]|uniref:hypothetical protein n=1 Tax=unclassified Streptomyces TaxID=2593676 RepID=UPI00190B8BCA|nr:MULTISPECIES: hypothetical protein [unclassified Streptomyces]MBK3556301.1 hypothetical protein [Streptomyces sp. MBT56]MBK3601233.1 hypothetical protein [Streptomyces sp. MBT54]MBK3614531.1 hypothetical protein [Streptomyces sp. MBT98]MBK6042824.1 hypothetical protein [Streptomyces sp. MBT55]